MLSRRLSEDRLARQVFCRVLRDNHFFGIILARAAPADDVHGRQLRAFELCNIPDMSHVGEVCHGHFDWKRFDL